MATLHIGNTLVSDNRDEMLVAADLCEEYGFADAAELLRNGCVTVYDNKPCRIQVGDSHCHAFPTSIEVTRDPFDRDSWTMDVTFRTIPE